MLSVGLRAETCWAQSPKAQGGRGGDVLRMLMVKTRWGRDPPFLLTSPTPPSLFPSAWSPTCEQFPCPTACQLDAVPAAR